VGEGEKRYTRLQYALSGFCADFLRSTGPALRRFFLFFGRFYLYLRILVVETADQTFDKLSIRYPYRPDAWMQQRHSSSRLTHLAQPFSLYYG
jgi:hypothetical protein